MNDARFTPPGTPVHDIAPGASEVPPKVLAMVRGAWLACLVSAAQTLFAGIAALSEMEGLVGAALILGMAYGISRKSRVCAVLMLVYFAVSRVLVYLADGPSIGMVLSAILLVLYVQGVAGTFEWHQARKTP